MKYIFFGSPEFAATILEKLIVSGIPPALVVCNPDRVAGRKKVLTPPLTKQTAKKHDIPIYQPEKLDKESIIKLGDIGTNFGIVAAYAQIIPQSVIDIFELGIVGVHPSLLPKHRGAAPIQTSILEGDVTTGTTLFLIDQKVDHGPILAQQKLDSLPDESKVELENRLAILSADLLIRTLPRFVERKISGATQNESGATFTKKFKTEDAYVSPEMLEKALAGDMEIAPIIHRKIRAFNPEPGAYTEKDGKRMKIFESKIENNRLILKKIQFEGKKPQIV